MHYYQFNIADYQSHTRHLSLIEDLCYRRMLDWQYLHEKPLPIEIEKTARLLLLNECLTDVERVLNEYFVLIENGWINVRAMAEIESYNEKIEKASLAGKASAAKRKQGIKQSFNGRSTDVQPNNKQEPLTNNHKPIKYIPPIPAELLSEWMQHRKKKPVTERVIKTIQAEANKLGWSLQQAIECSCANSWQGFKAEWVSKNKNDRSSVVNAAFGNLLKQYEVNEKDITNEVTIPNF